MNLRTILTGFCALSSGLGAFAQYTNVTTYDANVTPNAIWGSGNSNGGFTVNTTTNDDSEDAPWVELGLRARLRFDGTGQATNILNSQGNGTYVFQAGAAPGSPPPSWKSATTPVWSFDWSINTDPAGVSNAKLSAYTYLITMDFDPGPGQSLPLQLSFDPMDPATHPANYWDHSFGTNATLAGQGAEANSNATYLPLRANNNVAQNSWNYEFFNDGAYAGFNPNVNGTYTITLAWFEGAQQIGSTSIDVVVVPEPSTYAAIFVGLTLAVVVYRRRRAARSTPTA